MRIHLYIVRGRIFHQPGILLMSDCEDSASSMFVMRLCAMAVMSFNSPEVGVRAVGEAILADVETELAMLEDFVDEVRIVETSTWVCVADEGALIGRTVELLVAGLGDTVNGA